MPRPTTADPRAELINWEILDLDQMPPIDEWSEDEWEDAAWATLVDYYIKEREAGRGGGPNIPFEEVLAKRGLTLDDLS